VLCCVPQLCAILSTRVTCERFLRVDCWFRLVDARKRNVRKQKWLSQPTLDLVNLAKGRAVNYILISDVRALWRSALSARVPERQKLKCRLDLDGTEYFYKCNRLMPLHFKGLTYEEKKRMTLCCNRGLQAATQSSSYCHVERPQEAFSNSAKSWKSMLRKKTRQECIRY